MLICFGSGRSLEMMDKAGTVLPSNGAGEEAAWQELKAMLERRITEGVADGTFAKSIDAIMDEELGSRHLHT